MYEFDLLNKKKKKFNYKSNFLFLNKKESINTNYV